MNRQVNFSSSWRPHYLSMEAPAVTTTTKNQICVHSPGTTYIWPSVESQNPSSPHTVSFNPYNMSQVCISQPMQSQYPPDYLHLLASFPHLQIIPNPVNQAYCSSSSCTCGESCVSLFNMLKTHVLIFAVARANPVNASAEQP